MGQNQNKQLTLTPEEQVELYKEWEKGILTLIKAGDERNAQEYSKLRKSLIRLSDIETSDRTSKTYRRRLYQSLVSPVEDELRRTVLHWAALLCNSRIMESLLSTDSSGVNMQDELGFTPLHYLCEPLFDPWAMLTTSIDMVARQGPGCLESAQLLITNASTDLDVKDKRGRTALMLASQLMSSALVRLLLEHKADLKLRDNDDRTAFRHALDGNRYKNANALLEYGSSFDDLMIGSEDTGDYGARLASKLHKLLSGNHAFNSYESLVDLMHFLGTVAKAPSNEEGFSVAINLLGDSCAGKTSLAQSLRKEFPVTESYENRTVGVTVYKVPIENATVYLYDFAGHETYKMVHHLYANPGAINLIFLPIVLSPNWFKIQVLPWLNLITTKNPEATFVFILPKCDLISGSDQKKIEAQLQMELKSFAHDDVEHTEKWADNLKDFTDAGDGSDNAMAKQIIQETLLAKERRPFMWPVLLKVELKGGKSRESLSFLRESLSSIIMSGAGGERFKLLQNAPATWRRTAEVLEARQDGSLAIKLGEFIEIAAECGVSLPSADAGLDLAGAKAEASHEIEMCLTYLKVTGAVLHFENVEGSCRQYVFHDPKLLLPALGHLYHHALDSRLVPYFGSNTESLVKMRDEGRIPYHVLHKYMSVELACFDGVGPDLVDAILDMCTYFQLLLKLETQSGDQEFFIPSLVLRGKEAVPDLQARYWPEEVSNTVTYEIFLFVDTVSLPVGFFPKLSVSVTPFTKQKIDWRNGFFAEGIKSSLLVEECHKAVGSGFRFSFRVPDDRVGDAHTDMVWAYWTCLKSLSFYPGILFIVAGLCQCDRHMFAIGDYLTKSYEELCATECPKCTAGRVAADVFPPRIPESTKEAHRRVMNCLLREWMEVEAVQFLDRLHFVKGSVGRGKYHELRSKVESQGIGPLLDYLTNEKHFIRPGSYTWLCDALRESDLGILAQRVQDSILGVGPT